MIFHKISPKFRKSFPTLADLIQVGLISEDELIVIEDLQTKALEGETCYIPIVWAANLAQKARQDGRISDICTTNMIIEALNKFRVQCENLVDFNSITMPLVYTQVVTIATYAYFLAALIGHQYVNTKAMSKVGGLDLDMMPIFIILHYLFFMGWLKVAESLINPFGEDDDDFELEKILNKCIVVSKLMVDEMY